MVNKEPFGRLPDGREATRYVLAGPGITVGVVDLGAAVQSVWVPDAHGVWADVALGYGSAAGYADDGVLMGATVGPIANRVAGAVLEVAGRTCRLAANEGPNCNHTDTSASALWKRVWDAEEGPDSVTFSTVAEDGEWGLPGRRTFSVAYSIAGPGALSVRWRVETDRPTFCNLTNHAYLNLDGHGAGSVLGHRLTLTCPAFTPADAQSLPTGEVVPVEGTPFDFTGGKALGVGVDDPCDQVAWGRGFDRNLAVGGWAPDGRLRPVARLEGESGRVLELSTTLPGVQLYTGNWLDVAGAKDGASYGPRSGVALEPQYFPDTPHHPAFPVPVCDEGQPYDEGAVYAFSVTRP